MLFVGNQSIYLQNSLDENYSNVRLLLKGEDGNNTTTFTDHGPNRRVPASSSVTVNTSTQAKFGSGSIYSTGTYRIQYANSNTITQTIFGNNVWTMEGWVYLPFGLYGTFNSKEFTTAMNGSTANSPSTPNMSWFPTYLSIYTGAAEFRGTTTTPAANTWHHVVAQKNTSSNISLTTASMDMWINGQRLVITGGSSFSAGTNLTLQVGRGDNAPRPANYLDDFRITIGVTRYTPGAATITVPDREFGYAPR